MNVPKNARMLALLTLAITLGGCMLTGRGGPVIGVGFIAREPPPERIEVVTERPNVEAVWIGGHWTANGSEYAWASGRWEHPESGKTEWVNGKWEHEDRGWHYSEGHWR